MTGMPPQQQVSAQRLALPDALRGFAIVSIMLLHNIEHFDLYFTPQGWPAWLSTLDKGVWNTLFFLFGGKSYAIFALLFGLTFQLQDSRRAARGEDFRARFAWRMALLLGFGTINSMFYEGDILSMYAVLGLALIPVCRLSDRSVFLIAVALTLQPFAWYELLRALPDPALKLPDPASWAYFGRAETYLKGSSILDEWWGNLTNGKVGVIRWSWEMGRIFQIPALFMFGMLAGRRNLFALEPAARRFWARTLLLAALAFVPLYFAKDAAWFTADGLRRPASTILIAWKNLAFMLVLVSAFALLYRRTLDFFAPLGRMSLTSYMMQSVAGTVIYHGFGLGMYQYTGATFSLLIGVALALAQGWFSAWWLRRHSQGPLEAIWHRLTWGNSFRMA
ncbi:DUF418 domain-containing protein [Pseudoduganella sp. UC29_106]|uniref:DUF418 domain-containing protein n=1 Tax=Pseudoduganella sp. UC29_106 TaxID=3374553 RepID=UPI00375707D7